MVGGAGMPPAVFSSGGAPVGALGGDALVLTGGDAATGGLPGAASARVLGTAGGAGGVARFNAVANSGTSSAGSQTKKPGRQQ